MNAHVDEDQYAAAMMASTIPTAKDKVRDAVLYKRADMIRFVRRNPNCTVSEIAFGVEISPQNAGHHVRWLRENGVLIGKASTGRGKCVRYKVAA